MFEFEAELGPRGWQGKALGPFENDHGGFGEDVFKSKGLEIVEIVDAVEVGVVDLGGAGRPVDMNQRKGRTGDFVFGGSAESGYDAFGESGLPGAETPGEQHEYRRLKAFGEFPAPPRGFFRGVRDDFLMHAFSAPAGGDGAHGE